MLENKQQAEFTNLW